MIRFIKFALRIAFAVALAFPLAVLVTYAIVFKVRLGEQTVGEVINGNFVLPLSRALNALNVPDFGYIATVAGSLILTLPFCVLVVVIYVWLPIGPPPGGKRKT